MKKVLFIGHESDLNGASKSLLNIIDVVLSLGYEVHVLTSFSKGAFYEELRKRSVNIIVLPYERWCVQKIQTNNPIKNQVYWIYQKIKWYFKSKPTNIGSARKAARYIEEKSIDIIHSNTSVINIGAMIKHECDRTVKHIWHIREFADLDFNMYPLIRKTKYFDYMNQNTDIFICISKAVFDHYEMLDQNKKIVIYNGVDKTNSIHYSEKEEHAGVNFLISGRITETKGQHEAVLAVSELVKQGYTDFKLYIAGKGEQYFDIPEQCSDHIVLLGQVNDMRELRKKMDVELVCSKAEAFGRVTAEAMMASMPVIGSNTGGTPELIKDGETGFLYQRGDHVDLMNKMKLLIDNNELRNQMKQKAYHYASDAFTIDRCVEEIIKYY